MAAAMITTRRPSWPTKPAREPHRDEAAEETGPEVIGEMAWLLRDTRGSILLGGGMLIAIAVGIGFEAAFSRAALRPGAAGLAGLALLGGAVLCWLRAMALRLLAGRPVLDQLNESRWRTGGPVDLRTPWLSMPSVEDSQAEWNWARVNLLLSAARIRRERVHLADTWTFIATVAFLAWTAMLFL